MKKIFSILSILLFNFAHGYSQNAAEVSLRTKHFNLEKSGLAIQGYDPLSYYLGKPKKGSGTYSYLYNGVTYRFANAKNMELFKASPAKYEPAYGGWCAYAMGETGEKVKVDPDTYKIIDGKIYLFYNFWGNNTLADWNKNDKKLKVTADNNWKKITQ